MTCEHYPQGGEILCTECDLALIRRFELAKAIEDASLNTTVSGVIRTIAGAIRDNRVNYARHAVILVWEELEVYPEVLNLLKAAGYTKIPLPRAPVLRSQ